MVVLPFFLSGPKWEGLEEGTHQTITNGTPRCYSTLPSEKYSSSKRVVTILFLEKEMNRLSMIGTEYWEPGELPKVLREERYK